MTKEQKYKEFADTISFISKNFELAVGYLKDENMKLALEGASELPKILEDMDKIIKKERAEESGIVLPESGIQT